MGRVMGFEPTNTGTTTRGLNHLATLATYLSVILNLFLNLLFSCQIFVVVVPCCPETV